MFAIIALFRVMGSNAPGDLPMATVLSHNAYGKSQVRVTKVTRHAGRHDLKELTVDIQLEGAFAASYTQGDNRRVVATDSMKNAVYVLARDHPLSDIEGFGQTLADHFIENYAHVTSACIRLIEQAWQRIVVKGEEHAHAFLGGANEGRTASVTRTRQGLRFESGLEDLLLLKTTDSAFRGFIRDRYTTLPETDDRIFATKLTAVWLYGSKPADWNRAHQLIRQTILEVFAEHRSLAVQETLYAMGKAALNACPEIEEIRLTMPNQHRILVNLHPFGLDNPNVVFVPTDEPFGLISGTLRRG
jgi:urate oxidase